jgi:hypothetical protein
MAVVLGLIPAVVVVTRERVYQLLLILLVFMTVSSALSDATVMESLLRAAQLGFYVGLSAVVAATLHTSQWMHRFWMAAIFGMAISGMLTIVDFVGIWDVPRNNELGFSTQIGSGRVEQAAGFFFNRTGMAAVFVFSITGALIIAIANNNLAIRVKCGLAAAIGLIAIALTHNRSAVLSSVLAMLAYIVMSGRLGSVRRVRQLIAVAVAGFVCIGVLLIYFPEHVAVYVEKLAFVSGSDAASESDRSRFTLFMIAVKSLGVSLIGNGFTDVKYGLMESQRINPHNIITGLLWGAGILFIVWLPFFVVTLRSRVVRALKVVSHDRTTAVYLDAACYALLAWLLHNMTHYSLNTGIVWVGLGVILAQYGQGTGHRPVRPSWQMQ